MARQDPSRLPFDKLRIGSNLRRGLEAIPAMPTSMASTRFSASRFFSIAAVQSSVASFEPRRRIIAPTGKGVDSFRTNNPDKC